MWKVLDVFCMGPSCWPSAMKRRLNHRCSLGFQLRGWAFYQCLNGNNVVGSLPYSTSLH